MTSNDTPRALAETDLAGHILLRAGSVDLRRDIYLLVQYIEDKGLTRTKRLNSIPKTVGRRLAKILSYAGEADAVEEDGEGFWSHYVCKTAREMGLVKYDTEGVYLGYSSTEPSFPDNHVTVQSKAWTAYLARSPVKKEQAILDALTKQTESEFFHEATLVSGDAFDPYGSATGPAGQMKLRAVRRGLLDFLSELESDVWYDLRSVVDLLQARRPHLILDPDKRGPDNASSRRLHEWERERAWGTRQKKPAKKPHVDLEDIYVNFKEYPDGANRFSGSAKERQITADTPDAFHKVEGRYLERFLAEIPYLCGFVDLAYRPEDDPHGTNVFPLFEQLRAFRLTRCFFQLLGKSPEMNRVKVTVLPTFEVLVEAPSYPETTLAQLDAYTDTVAEDGPIHRLKIRRQRVVAAAQDAPPPAETLRKLTGAPLPENVATELGAWTHRGMQLVIYEDCALVELAGGESTRRAALDALGPLTCDDESRSFVIAHDPKRAFDRLEQAELVPVRVYHREGAFASCASPLGISRQTPDTRPAKKPAPRARRPEKASLRPEDLAGYHSDQPALLEELHRLLRPKARTCVLTDKKLLVLSASSLPDLRAALRSLGERFAVTMETSDGGGGET